jgi:hypothetical protein
VVIGSSGGSASPVATGHGERIEEQEIRIAATINAQGFDPSKEIGDLPYFVGEAEFKKRHGDSVPVLIRGNLDRLIRRSITQVSLRKFPRAFVLNVMIILILAVDG